MQLSLADSTLEIVDVPGGGTAVDVPHFDRTLLLEEAGDTHWSIGMRLRVAGEELASLRIASAVPIQIDPDQTRFAAGALLLGVGRHLVRLSLPALEVEWAVQVDEAACFGVHLAPDGEAVVTHGELSVRRFGLDGSELWRREGADIFTTPEGSAFTVDAAEVRTVDWSGRHYRFDLASGEPIA